MLAKGHVIADVDLSFLHFDFRIYRRMEIAEILQMSGDVLYGTPDHFRVVYYRRHADFLHEPVPSLSFSVRPIVYVQKRIPSEYEIRIRLLLQIRLYLAGVE